MSAIHLPGLTAVWRRQLGSLLGNPLGYIFILAFVIVASAFLFLPDSFYARNICDLGPLWADEGTHPPLMPLLLAVLLPALAMGAWASEREQGTEEVLLTMPLGIVDAILGKYLAVVSYFTIALACSLSMVVVLWWLGDPDFGLLIANYIGWWFAGLAFAAWGLLASVMVSLPAIAFVLGAVFCAVLMLGGNAVHWFEEFNRGIFSVGGVVSAIAAAAVGLGLSVLILASRRWRPALEQVIVANILSLVFAVVIAVNFSRGAYRFGVDADISTEGLSSLSAESGRILSAIENQVTVAAFISTDLPSELQKKRKEIEDKLQALKRMAGSKVKIEIYRPTDQLDQYGQLATRDYGLKPRKELVDTVSGKEFSDVFLGAAVTSGGNTQLIEYFDPGLSVEYEIVRAVRTVGSSKKRVLGIATTDMEINSGFDMQSMQMRPAWQVVEEWKRQYEVREVDLKNAVSSDIEVLVVAQPSSLTDVQVNNLHDYIWNGGPTLLMEDPLPIFGGAQLAISQPKKNNAGPYGGGGNDEKKGDIKPLFKALGIDFDPNVVSWSDYNPSHEFRDRLTKNFVWVRRDQGGIFDSADTAGINAVLFPFPGVIREANDKSPKLTVTPLIRPSPKAAWGQHFYSDHVSPGMFGGMQQKEIKRWTPSDPMKLPYLAVDITGTMPSAFPKPDPDAKAPEKKEGEAEPAPWTPPTKPGVSSPKPIHVIVVADSDFANDAFFQFYRNTGNNFSKDELKFLLALKNVQFVGNAVDALAADQDFLKLRTRQPQNRPLVRLEQVYMATEEKRTKDADQAKADAESKLDKANADFQANIARIQMQEGLDDVAKQHLAEQTRAIGQRSLDVEKQKIDIEQEKKDNAAKAEQRRTISAYRVWVRWLALGIPFLGLAALVLAVFLNRLNRERSHIPASRKRGIA